LPQIKNAAIYNLTGALEMDSLSSNKIVWDKKEKIGQITLK